MPASLLFAKNYTTTMQVRECRPFFGYCALAARQDSFAVKGEGASAYGKYLERQSEGETLPRRLAPLASASFLTTIVPLATAKSSQKTARSSDGPTIVFTIGDNFVTTLITLFAVSQRCELISGGKHPKLAELAPGLISLITGGAWFPVHDICRVQLNSRGPLPAGFASSAHAVPAMPRWAHDMPSQIP